MRCVRTIRFGDDEVGGEYRDVNVRKKDEGMMCVYVGRYPFSDSQGAKPGLITF